MDAFSPLFLSILVIFRNRSQQPKALISVMDLEKFITVIYMYNILTHLIFFFLLLLYIVCAILCGYFFLSESISSLVKKKKKKEKNLD